MMAAFILLESTCFLDNSKWMLLFSLSNRAIFFLGIFLFLSLQKTRTFILTFMMRGNSIIAFHYVFMITFYAVTLQKLFFTDET